MRHFVGLKPKSKLLSELFKIIAVFSSLSRFYKKSDLTGFFTDFKHLFSRSGQTKLLGESKPTSKLFSQLP